MALRGMILDPVVAHVHCLRTLLRDFVIGDAFGCAVVGLHGRFALWMAKFIERSVNGFSILAGIE